MGVFDSINKFIQNVSLNDNKKTASFDVHSREIRERAAKFGISPEEFVSMMNGSLYNFDTEENFFSDYNNSDSDSEEYTLDMVRNNTLGRFGNLKIVQNSDFKHDFGLTEAYEDFNKKVKQSQWYNMIATEQNGKAEYEVASNERESAQQEADQNNANAENQYNAATKQAKNDNTAANNALATTEKNAAANNTAATKQLKETTSTVEDNIGVAEDELSDTRTLYQQKVLDAETSLKSAESEQAKNDKEAAEKVDSLDEEVKGFDEKINSLNGEIAGLDTTITNIGNQVSNLDTQINKLGSTMELTGAQENILANLKEQREQLNIELTKAKEEKATKENELEKTEQDKDAKQKELDDAKTKQEETKIAGENAVNTARTHLEAVQQEAKKAIDAAEKRLLEVKKEGADNITKAQQNANTTAEQGRAAVAQQQVVVTHTQNTGELNIKKAKDNMIITEATGEKNIKAAKSNEKKVKDQVQKDDQEAERNYHQVSNGSETELIKTGTAGTRSSAGNAAQIRAQELNPTDGTHQIKTDVMQGLKQTVKDEARKIDILNSPPSRAILEKAAADRYDREIALGNTTKGEVLPDGDMNINNSQLQGKADDYLTRTALESIEATEDGEQMIQSHMYRDELRGVTTVHLQEAEDNGNGPDGNGIYTFTDNEIIKASKRFGCKDGNVVAYMLAMEQYAQENGKQQEESVENNDPKNRIYEIISGKKV